MEELNRFKNVNLYMYYDPDKRGSLSSLVFQNSDEEDCNIIVIDEFDKVLLNVTDDSQNKNRGERCPKPTDNIQSFLKLMDEIGDQPNTILLLTTELYPNEFAYNKNNNTVQMSAFREGRVDMIIRYEKHVDLSQDYLQNMMNNRMYVDDMNRWKRIMMKKSADKFYKLYKRSTFKKLKEKLIKKYSLQTKKSSNITKFEYGLNKNTMYNINFFTIYLAFIILKQLVCLLFIIIMEVAWLFSERKIIYIDKDLNYKFVKRSYKNYKMNFHHCDNIKEKNKLNDVMYKKNKIKSIILCYYFSVFTNFYKDVQKIYNNDLKLNNKFNFKLNKVN